MNANTGIGTPHTLPITQLSTYHKNPRRGDIQAIAGSLAANGQFRPIVVNKGTHTGRPYEILAGNHTYLAHQYLAEAHPDNPQWQHIDTYLVDVDDDRATKIVLADNRTADLGSYDNDTLLDLLDNLDGDYLGTGYDEDYIGALLGENTPEEGLPEAGDADIEDDPISYAIVIECDTYEQQTKLLDRFIEEGLNCRAIM